MKTDYEEVFRHRGKSYHHAMKKYPKIRKKEFQNLFLRNRLLEEEVVIDCPSLGGYLQDAVEGASDVRSLDFCFSDGSVQEVSSEGWSVPFSADRVVCLAASHHIDDLRPYLSSVESTLKKGGTFHLADIESDSSIRHFLDDFVGDWTSTGHHGIWRNFSELSSKVESQGVFLASRIEKVGCPWDFSSLEEALDFCRLLFGLDLKPSDKDILCALDEYVGVEFLVDGFRVNWELSYVDFQRTSE